MTNVQMTTKCIPLELTMRFNYIKKLLTLYVLYTLRKGFFFGKKKKKNYDNLEFDGWNYLTDVHEKRT